VNQGPFKDVLDFHRKFGVATPLRPTIPGQSVMALRYKLRAEERRELDEAIMAHDLPAMVHETIDNIVVLLGDLASYGVDFQPAWDAIHAANMAKSPNPDGGKILKPPGWKKAEVTPLLLTQGDVLESYFPPSSSPVPG
jgi:predicted HAD superfamily Cof-like phosphohydrolase